MAQYEHSEWQGSTGGTSWMQRAMVKLFRTLTEEQGVTIVMTTHDTDLMELGDQVYELEGGELIHGE